MKKAYQRILVITFIKVICGAFVFASVGCSTLKDIAEIDNPCQLQPAVGSASNVSLFLNVHRRDAVPNITLKISAIELLVDDLWVPFSADAIEVKSADSNHTQRFLGRQWLKGQFCRGVRVKLAASPPSFGINGETPSSSGHPDAEIILQNPFALESDSRKVLFIEWDPAKSYSAPESKDAGLSAYQSVTPRIFANLVYVACPDIETVYVVRADKLQVVDAFAAHGKSNYLAADLNKKTVYVLSESLGKIVPYDVSTHFPGSEINVPLANSPIFMLVNNGRQIAYVLDAYGVLTSIDLGSGNMVNRNRVGNRPNFICYLAGLNKLAVSSAFDQTVYLVNPDSLVVEDSIALGSSPLGLMGLGSYLYIAEGLANSVSIYDLIARKVLKSVRVGFEPSRFVVSNNSVYVTNYGEMTISVMQAGQFSVIKEIKVGNHPMEMVVAEKQRLLFVGVGDCEDGSLAVVDTTGNQVVGRIELGAKAGGLAVIE